MPGPDLALGAICQSMRTADCVHWDTIAPEIVVEVPPVFLEWNSEIRVVNHSRFRTNPRGAAIAMSNLSLSINCSNINVVSFDV
jgi:hypothetical protein